MRTILITLFITIPLFANIVVDDMLLIPRTYGNNPIDMESNEPPQLLALNRTYLNQKHSIAPQNEKVCVPWFKVLYSDAAVYYICQVIDDTVTHEDSWEFYFDGDRSAGNEFDKVNDTHFRINFGLENADSMWVSEYTAKNQTFDTSLIKMHQYKTQGGWLLILKIQMELLEIEAEEGWEVGFEVQYNNINIDTTMYRWWSLNKNASTSPAVWGQALLTFQVADTEVFYIPGLLNDFTLKEAVNEERYWPGCFSAENFTFFDGHTFLNKIDNDYICYSGWDCNGIYFYIKAYDDVVFVNDDSSNTKGDHIELEIITWDGADKTSVFSIDLPMKNNELNYFLNSNTVCLTEQGWEQEVSLNFNQLGLDRSTGGLFFLNVQKYDNDGYGLKSRASWLGGNQFNIMNPDEWPIYASFFPCDGCACPHGSGPQCPPDKVENQNRAQINFVLYPAYRNPFNSSTKIEYQLQSYTNVHIAIYNNRGQLVKTLVNEQQGPSNYLMNWNGMDDKGNILSSGVYFLQTRIETQYMSECNTSKLVLMK